VKFGKQIMAAVLASVKGELRIGRSSREAILDFLLKWLERQSKKNEGQDGWDSRAVEALTDSLRHLSEDVYLTIEKNTVKVGCKPRSYNMLAALQRGTRLLDPIDKLPEVLLSIVSEQ
jgi:hypothetical protein